MKRKPAGSNGRTATSTGGNHVSSNSPDVKSRESKYRRARMQDLTKQMKADQAEKRAKIVLWKRPITTLQYFVCELLLEIKRLVLGLLQHRVKVSLLTLLVLICTTLYFIDTPLQPYINRLEVYVLWCLYWVGLGILSSVGLGTGLHTFLLYLGPFIASVTLAAFTCNSLDFPAPPYPTDIICPEEEVVEGTVTFWAIMSKVRLEACMWGAGTALGELPPYFMARAARLSGSEGEEEEYKEIESLLSSDKKDPLTHAKKAVYKLVKKVGFFGILLSASIPNPLFDLAGITCGHFLVPFWTFFGATLIGKAIVKMHIQVKPLPAVALVLWQPVSFFLIPPIFVLPHPIAGDDHCKVVQSIISSHSKKVFVILAFSEHHVEAAVKWIGNIPYIGSYIQSPFSEYLDTQKRQLHRKPGESVLHETSRLQQVFGYILLVMVVYFLLSIVNSMAQSYAKRIDEEQVRKKQAS